MITKKDLHNQKDYMILAREVKNRSFLVRILGKKKFMTHCPHCKRVNFKHAKNCPIPLQMVGIKVKKVAENKKIEYVKHLAAKWLKLKEEMEAREKELEFLKEDIRLLEQQEIPEAMVNLDTDELALNDEYNLVIKPTVVGSIPPEKEDQCFKWMEKHGYGSLIKSTFKIEFDRLKGKSIERFRTMLHKSGYIAKDGSFTEKRGVLPQTLNKFLREAKEGGLSVPRSKFNVTEIEKAKLRKRR